MLTVRSSEQRGFLYDSFCSLQREASAFSLPSITRDREGILIAAAELSPLGMCIRMFSLLLCCTCSSGAVLQLPVFCGTAGLTSRSFEAAGTVSGHRRNAVIRWCLAACSFSAASGKRAADLESASGRAPFAPGLRHCTPGQGHGAV